REGGTNVSQTSPVVASSRWSINRQGECHMVIPQGECHMVIPTVPGIPEHRDHPPAPPRRWIGRIRRARYFSPLALILALILSAASWAPLASTGLVPRAQAVTPIDP